MFLKFLLDLKSQGGIRIILNLSKLNLDVQYEHFKMETLNSALLLIEKNCFFGSIDLQDAYYSVNVHRSFRKYLRFTWNSCLYEFSCLPNGLACAPRVFTKILKPLYENLRQKGLLSIYYLDDSLLFGNSFESCKHNIIETSTLLKKAGFILNEKKSSLVPSQSIVFLGFCLDSVNMTISLTQEKRNRVLFLCNEILNLHYCKIRYLAQFIGVLVSCLPAVTHGELYYRYLELARNKALTISKGNYDCETSIDMRARKEIMWWKSNIALIKKDLFVPAPDLILTTDVSLSGWGAIYEGQSSGGHWNSNECD